MHMNVNYQNLLLACSLFAICISCAPRHPDAKSEQTNTEEKALELFRAYSPKIEAEHGPILYTRTITGDLNGDTRDDVIVEFGIGNRGGGNGIVFKQSALYLDTERGPKVVGAFNPDFCFSVQSIAQGTVTVEELEACILPWPKIMAIHEYRFEHNQLLHRRKTVLDPPRSTEPAQ